MKNIIKIKVIIDKIKLISAMIYCLTYLLAHREFVGHLK